jgi:hypothetical protein
MKLGLLFISLRKTQQKRRKGMNREREEGRKGREGRRRKGHFFP